jgi:hypothetical protein
MWLKQGTFFDGNIFKPWYSFHQHHVLVHLQHIICAIVMKVPPKKQINIYLWRLYACCKFSNKIKVVGNATDINTKKVRIPMLILAKLFTRTAHFCNCFGIISSDNNFSVKTILRLQNRARSFCKSTLQIHQEMSVCFRSN